jgi:hypothetical protein
VAHQPPRLLKPANTRDSDHGTGVTVTAAEVTVHAATARAGLLSGFFFIVVAAPDSGPANVPGGIQLNGCRWSRSPQLWVCASVM